MTETATMAMPQIHDTILDAIGNTPLVRLNRVNRGVRAQVLAKVEYMNPGGSVKDRIGIAMIEDAERSGRLKPGGTIVEPTSGNTGAGLAIAAAIRGYKTIFVMPDKMSDEKIRYLRALGAKVVITPTAVEPDDPRSYYSVSKRLAEETPNAILAGQYWNQANPEAHYRTTGPEIWRQTAGKIDAFIAGMGTGGTISGTAKFLKEQNPNIQVVGIDPVGSLYTEYFRTGQLGPAFGYKVEGVGEDFLPTTMHFQYVDDVVQVGDKESFVMTRRMVREEGLFVGGSCGMAVAGAMRWLRAQNWDESKTAVILLPDSGVRYISKIFSDDWMRENGFLESEPISQLLDIRPRSVISAKATHTVAQVIQDMKANDISQMPVVRDDGTLVGLITEVDLLDYLLSGAGQMDHQISDIVSSAVATVGPDTSIDALTEVFSRGQVGVVVDESDVVRGIITKIDMIDYLANKA
ncbi:cystathionine beta-synthase [Herpetosiphon sp.]|uniref:Cystathionine beta-synthase n=1 Tax=Herpetosiphon aurantiacus (strain ATCC 23779 / DSM 785 / 114-95) TaxID=316274 RepID=A9B771_HERA2|nr:cystathionine beta-synthase [Herpetosiphon sp.]ABX06354.1 cystathionine beta-synthase [Herpetosiphon aurantiacus DSM 785]